MPRAQSHLRSMVPLLSVQFMGTIGYSLALPFLVFLVSDFGGATWTFGLLGATYSACQLGAAPVLGQWSDSIGRRPILILSQAGTLVAWLLFLGALGLPRWAFGTWAGAELTLPLLVVFLARGLDGLTGGNVSVANALVADLKHDDPEGRRVAFGQMGMAASLGFVVGPALAGLLSDTPWGYAAPVSAAIALSAVATGLCLGIVEPPRANLQEPQEPPALPRLLGQQHRRCDAVVQPPRQGSLTRFPVAGLLVSTFVQFLAFNLFYVAFPLHAEGVLGWTGRTMGLFFAVMSGVMLIAQGPLLAMLTARLPPSWVFGLGTGVLVLSFASFAIPGASIPFLGAVLFALGNGVAWPTFQDRIADAAGDEEQGAVQGAATSAGAFASILGLLAGGFLYPHFGAGLFLVAAFLYAVIGAATPLWFSSRAGPTTG